MSYIYCIHFPPLHWLYIYNNNNFFLAFLSFIFDRVTGMWGERDGEWIRILDCRDWARRLPPGCVSLKLLLWKTSLSVTEIFKKWAFHSYMFADCSQDSDSHQTGNLFLCWIHNIFSTRSHLHCAALTPTSYVYVSESMKWIAGDFLDLATHVFAHRRLQEIEKFIKTYCHIRWN